MGTPLDAEFFRKSKALDKLKRLRNREDTTPISDTEIRDALLSVRKLDKENRARVSYIDVNGKNGIVIENELEPDSNCIKLRADQALSLLAWLLQERPHLEKMVGELKEDN